MKTIFAFSIFLTLIAGTAHAWTYEYACREPAYNNELGLPVQPITKIFVIDPNTIVMTDSGDITLTLKRQDEAPACRGFVKFHGEATIDKSLYFRNIRLSESMLTGAGAGVGASGLQSETIPGDYFYSCYLVRQI